MTTALRVSTTNAHNIDADDIDQLLMTPPSSSNEPSRAVQSEYSESSLKALPVEDTAASLFDKVVAPQLQSMKTECACVLRSPENTLAFAAPPKRSSSTAHNRHLFDRDKEESDDDLDRDLDEALGQLMEMTPSTSNAVDAAPLHVNRLSIHADHIPSSTNALAGPPQLDAQPSTSESFQPAPQQPQPPPPTTASRVRKPAPRNRRRTPAQNQMVQPQQQQAMLQVQQQAPQQSLVQIVDGAIQIQAQVMKVVQADGSVSDVAIVPKVTQKMAPNGDMVLTLETNGQVQTVVIPRSLLQQQAAIVDLTDDVKDAAPPPVKKPRRALQPRPSKRTRALARSTDNRPQSSTMMETPSNVPSVASPLIGATAATSMQQPSTPMALQMDRQAQADVDALNEQISAQLAHQQATGDTQQGEVIRRLVDERTALLHTLSQRQPQMMENMNAVATVVPDDYDPTEFLKQSMESPPPVISMPDVETPSTSNAGPNHDQFHTLMSNDLMALVNMDTKTPFVDKRDALNRLLPTHLYHQPNIKEEILERVDAALSSTFASLAEEAESLYDKYSALLHCQSMRVGDNTEDCLTLYLLNTEETNALNVEKNAMQADFESFARSSTYLKENHAELVEAVFPKAVEPTPTRSTVERTTRRFDSLEDEMMAHCSSIKMDDLDDDDDEENVEELMDVFRRLEDGAIDEIRPQSDVKDAPVASPTRCVTPRKIYSRISGNITSSESEDDDDDGDETETDADLTPTKSACRRVESRKAESRHSLHSPGAVSEELRFSSMSRDLWQDEEPINIDLDVTDLNTSRRSDLDGCMISPMMASPESVKLRSPPRRPIAVKTPRPPPATASTATPVNVSHTSTTPSSTTNVNDVPSPDISSSPPKLTVLEPLVSPRMAPHDIASTSIVVGEQPPVPLPPPAIVKSKRKSTTPVRKARPVEAGLDDEEEDSPEIGVSNKPRLTECKPPRVTECKPPKQTSSSKTFSNHSIAGLLSSTAPTLTTKTPVKPTQIAGKSPVVLGTPQRTKYSLTRKITKVVDEMEAPKTPRHTVVGGRSPARRRSTSPRILALPPKMRAKAMAQQHAAAMALKKTAPPPPVLSPMKPTGLKIRLKLPTTTGGSTDEQASLRRREEKRLKREKKLERRERRAERQRMEVKIVTPLKLKLPKMEMMMIPETKTTTTPTRPQFFTSSPTIDAPKAHAEPTLRLRLPIKLRLPRPEESTAAVEVRPPFKNVTKTRHHHRPPSSIDRVPRDGQHPGHGEQPRSSLPSRMAKRVAVAQIANNDAREEGKLKTIASPSIFVNLGAPTLSREPPKLPTPHKDKLPTPHKTKLPVSLKSKLSSTHMPKLPTSHEPKLPTQHLSKPPSAHRPKPPPTHRSKLPTLHKPTLPPTRKIGRPALLAPAARRLPIVTLPIDPVLRTSVLDQLLPSNSPATRVKKCAPSNAKCSMMSGPRRDDSRARPPPPSIKIKLVVPPSVKMPTLSRCLPVEASSLPTQPRMIPLSPIYDESAASPVNIVIEESPASPTPDMDGDDARSTTVVKNIPSFLPTSPTRIPSMETVKIRISPMAKVRTIPVFERPAFSDSDEN